jgi:hypothetical protein
VFPVGVVGGGGPPVILHIGTVLHRFIEAVLGDPAQERLRVVSTGLPQVPVQADKQGAHRTLPAVHQIVGQFGQSSELLRNPGLYFKRKY